MKSKIFGLIAMLCIVWMPNEVFASSSEYELVSESTKYYKTVTYYRNDISLSNIMLNANYIPYSETIEITEDEYLYIIGGDYSVNEETEIIDFENYFTITDLETGETLETNF